MLEVVAKQMQASVLNWEGLLKATGSALVPKKCFWYLISFEIKYDKWCYQAKSQ